MTDRPPTTAEEMRRALEGQGVPPPLARALDRITDGWALLWVQRTLLLTGDPDHLERAAGAEPERRYKATRARTRLRAVQAPDGGPPLLQAHAWDRERGLVLLPPDREHGGRPRSLLHALVSALYEEMDLPPGDEGRNLRSVRERIATLLTPYFPPAELDPARGALISRTLRNHLRRR